VYFDPFFGVFRNHVGGNEDCTRLLKFKLAGVLKKLHQKELVEEAATLYLEINETGLAHAAALEAAAWGT
jgi:hypothetical protein